MCGGMQLLPDPLYSLPTDNTYLLTITSTDNGRIFLAGKDGCLYEVAYQVSLALYTFFSLPLDGVGIGKLLFLFSNYISTLVCSYGKYSNIVIAVVLHDYTMPTKPSLLPRGQSHYQFCVYPYRAWYIHW